MKTIHIFKVIGTLLLISLVTNCSIQNKSIQNEKRISIKNFNGIIVPTDSIDSFLQSKMTEQNIPGLSIAIINDSKVVYHKTSGYANKEKKLPVTNKTIFEGASISKSVFASFVMTYVEEGKLDLDKPLYQYLPYPDIEYDDRYKKITARIVLSHRSGFPNWRENEKDKKLILKFEPGTSYEYSGEGYQYLAMVLKHIGGTDWNGLETTFQKKIANPLGLEHTTFIEDSYTMENKAEPYKNNGEWIDWKNEYWYKKDKGIFVPAASIRTEPIDFSKWMIDMMNKKLLTKNSYKELFKHHSTLSPPEAETQLYYTLGFTTANDPFTTAYFHGGTNDGFTCFYFMDTSKKWGYVLFTNSEYGETLGYRLLDYLAKENY
ncbi:serine hydrolase domain-containing protein [Flavivirga aquimarina]|uniref:Serine hydrolase domain-containing protein n=1 Tax=Flavivirga aquimarina TaxID=2027862 RepID=A0ABT8WC17_9FLAO|nr:serine hydrolase domain-containing protein [Flavivirga aquimarina]MDO5970584.1 serine hydrolase domain-containing protein [Flavivirga aquimarina]